MAKDVSMRNHLVHAYFNVDINIILITVQQALPELKEKLQPLLEQ